MAHDLHVFDQAFGLPPMCGEEGVTCAPGMPKFSESGAQRLAGDEAASRATGPHQEDKSAWALEVALDVETSHAIAPGGEHPARSLERRRDARRAGLPEHDEGRGLRRLDTTSPR